jgi:hypothetical protein
MVDTDKYERKQSYHYSEIHQHYGHTTERSARVTRNLYFVFGKDPATAYVDLLVDNLQPSVTRILSMVETYWYKGNIFKHKPTWKGLIIWSTT